MLLSEVSGQIQFKRKRMQRVVQKTPTIMKVAYYKLSFSIALLVASLPAFSNADTSLPPVPFDRPPSGPFLSINWAMVDSGQPGGNDLPAETTYSTAMRIW